MEALEYIKVVRKMSIADAAREIGISRTWLSQICNGHQPVARKLAKKISEWSGGNISEFELTYPEHFRKN